MPVTTLTRVVALGGRIRHCIGSDTFDIRSMGVIIDTDDFVWFYDQE